MGRTALRFTGWIVNDLNAAFIEVTFICKRLGIRRNLPLCIDTGAAMTCLHERDAINLRIDLSKLRKRERPAVGIGGTADVYLLDDVKLRFVRDDGMSWDVAFEEMPVIVPQRNRVKRKRVLGYKRGAVDARGIPSLLGFDLLRCCDISFYDDAVYLDVSAARMRALDSTGIHQF